MAEVSFACYPLVLEPGSVAESKLRQHLTLRPVGQCAAAAGTMAESPPHLALLFPEPAVEGCCCGVGVGGVRMQEAALAVL